MSFSAPPFLTADCSNWGEGSVSSLCTLESLFWQLFSIQFFCYDGWTLFVNQTNSYVHKVY